MIKIIKNKNDLLKYFKVEDLEEFSYNYNGDLHSWLTYDTDELTEMLYMNDFINYMSIDSGINILKKENINVLHKNGKLYIKHSNDWYKITITQFKALINDNSITLNETNITKL